MQKPPKGMRTYLLVTDSAVVDDQPTKIAGSLVVMLRASTSERKHGYNTFWRLEVIKANNLSRVLLADGTLKNPNPFVEIYWRGPCMKFNNIEIIDSWTLIGHTRSKSNTCAPEFEKDIDNSLFELPPTWTDLDIPRSAFEEQVQVGGGFVARNQQPVPLAQHDGQCEAKHISPAKKLPFGASSEAEVLKMRVAVKYNDLLTKEVQERLEMKRYLVNAEEIERKCMGQEERHLRTFLITTELKRSSSLVAKQTEYSRAFMRLLHLVQSPPNVLARLRFLMGEESKAGTRQTMCEDPATGAVFNVVSTPVLNAQDEQFMVSQMNGLFGVSCPNLIKVVDFSIHQLRDFNDKGFSCVDERVAIGVMEYVEGESVMKFLDRNWDTVSNDTFREILRQIMFGLSSLHKAGVLHRNVHPDAVAIETPDRVRNTEKRKLNGNSRSLNLSSLTKAKSGSAKVLQAKLVCRLGDYWFLHNPRNVGCEASLGRSNWGSKMTAPPEGLFVKSYKTETNLLPSDRVQFAVAAKMSCLDAVEAQSVSPLSIHNMTTLKQTIINERSDVFAFGVCVYFWATKGLHKSVPLHSGYSNNNVNFPVLHQAVPLKWKTWLHSLLDMCLQTDSTNRATSSEILQFLSSRLGK
jgi:serine/threonine protein kinase